MPGTTIAGDTAASMNPNDKASVKGIPMIQTEAPATVKASTIPGRSVSRSEIQPDLSTASMSISHEESKSIVQRLIVLMSSSNRSGRLKSLILALLRMIPEINDPNNGGIPKELKI